MMIEILAKTRYVFAVLMLATMPAAVLYWYLIHPFAAFWRRLGATASFVIVGAVSIGVAFWIGSFHRQMLSSSYPFSWILTAIGGLMYIGAAYLDVTCRRQLKFAILTGVPEIGDDPGHLLTTGLYARTRNPRYLSLFFGIGGVALILNYPAVYLMVLLMLPALWILILLEERELKQRFGTEYEEYLSAVPRLIPRLGRHNAG